MKGENKFFKDEMRQEYDLDYSKGLRGKYYQRIMTEGVTITMLPGVESVSPSHPLSLGRVSRVVSRLWKRRANHERD